MSGIEPGKFLFLGFPPRKSGELKGFLRDIQEFPYTLIFYESPRRVKDFLTTAASVLGHRDFAVVKELSKRYEWAIRGNLGNMERLLKEEEFLGEMVIVVQGYSKDTPGPEKETLKLETMDDLFSYFKENHNISKNQLKKILMKRDK